MWWWYRRQKRTLSWVFWLLALLGVAGCRKSSAPLTDEERERRREKRTRFRQKIREAFAVWNEDSDHDV